MVSKCSTKSIYCAFVLIITVLSAVTFAAPAITSITPNTAKNWGRIGIAELSGSGFEEGAVVTLKKEGQPDIVVLTVVESATKISGRFNAVETQPGIYDVVVTNPDEQSTTLNAGFTLTVPLAPILNSSTPDLADNMGLVKIELTGNNFLENPIVKIIREGQSDIDATSVMVESPNKLVCDFSLTGVTLGSWTIKIINPDGQTN